MTCERKKGGAEPVGKSKKGTRKKKCTRKKKNRKERHEAQFARPEEDRQKGLSTEGRK